jgi:hypothetical protein
MTDKTQPLHEFFIPGFQTKHIIWGCLAGSIAPILGIILYFHDQGFQDGETLIFSYSVFILFMIYVLRFVIKNYPGVRLILYADRLVHRVKRWNSKVIEEEIPLSEIINIEYGFHKIRIFCFDPIHKITLNRISLTTQNRKRMDIVYYSGSRNDGFLAITATIEHQLLLPNVLSRLAIGEFWNIVFLPSFSVNESSLALLDGIQLEPKIAIPWSDIISVDIVPVFASWPTGGQVIIKDLDGKKYSMPIPVSLPHVFQEIVKKYAQYATVSSKLTPMEILKRG